MVFQNPMSGEFISQVPVLKVGVPDVGHDPLVLRKKLQVLDSLPIVYHHAGFGVYGEIIVPAFPTHYDAVSPLICPL